MAISKAKAKPIVNIPSQHSKPKRHYIRKRENDTITLEQLLKLTPERLIYKRINLRFNPTHQAQERHSNFTEKT